MERMRSACILPMFPTLVCRSSMLCVLANICTVKPNTALDREARKRATTVYLVQRAVPMLPGLLCEQLCSLVPDVERLTFSCFFILDSEGNVLKKQIERSIIK